MNYVGPRAAPAMLIFSSTKAVAPHRVGEQSRHEHAPVQRSCSYKPVVCPRMNRMRACEEKRERVGLSIAKNPNSLARQSALKSSPPGWPQGFAWMETTGFIGESLLKALGKYMKAHAAICRICMFAQSR
jgi:hypothetical protein